MNKLSVLAKNPETYFIKRLREEVGNKGLQIINPWKGENVTSEGVILVRTTAVYGDNTDLDFLENWEGPIFNPLDCLKNFRTKSSQYKYFEELNVPLLPWMNLLIHSFEEVRMITGKWNSPLLIKPDRGQGGWGIKIINSNELSEWWSSPDHEFLIQPFVQNAKEFRVFFCKSEAPIVLEREGSEVANFAREGKAKLSQIQNGTSKIVHELIEKSGAHYGAIDLFETTDGPKILELNISPGIEQLEKVSGVDIMKKLLASL